MKPLSPLLLLLPLASLAEAAPSLPQPTPETVACHLTYGGETQTIAAAPTTSPYTVPAVAIGSYFLFRIVFRQEPADLASIKLYAYAARATGPDLVHQASYAYPLAHAAFTGQNFVYEPQNGGELQYHCELKADSQK